MMASPIMVQVRDEGGLQLRMFVTAQTVLSVN